MSTVHETHSEAADALDSHHTTPVHGFVLERDATRALRRIIVVLVLLLVIAIPVLVNQSGAPMNKSGMVFSILIVVAILLPGLIMLIMAESGKGHWGGRLELGAAVMIAIAGFFLGIALVPPAWVETLHSSLSPYGTHDHPFVELKPVPVPANPPAGGGSATTGFDIVTVLTNDNDIDKYVVHFEVDAAKAKAGIPLTQLRTPRATKIWYEKNGVVSFAEDF